jgi:PilZ domain
MPRATICGRQFVSETLSLFGDHTRMVEADAIAEIEERRKSTRAGVDEVAFISVAGSSTRCRIVNVSSDGAAVDVPDAAYIPNRFRLMTERDRLVRNCRIAWIKENRIGVEFERTPEQHPITHRERQFLQYLRDGGWRRAGNLPDSAKLISKLLWNGWIERSGSGSDVAYRITPKGLDAKTAPVKL